MRRSTLTEQGKRLRALLENPPAGRNPLEIFAKAFWPIVYPGKAFSESLSSHAITEFGWAWVKGEFSRGVGNAPPGSGKSTLIEVMLPCLVWGLLDPTSRWLTVAFEAPLAEKFNALRAALMQSPLYALTFPEIELNRDIRSEVANKHGGVMHAVSIGKSIIGKHYDFQIFGDLLNPTQVHSRVVGESQVSLQRAWNFVQEAITREGIGARLRQMVFAQRIHQFDPSGNFLAMFPDAAHLSLALDYDPETPASEWTKKLDTRTIRGQHPWRVDFDIKVKRKALGDERFEAQYNQKPQPPGGSVWKRDWNAQRYDKLPRHLERALFIQSWDGGLKGKQETHSRLVGQLWAKLDGKAYLLDETEPVQAEFVDALDVIKQAQARELWTRSKVILIENQAAGPGLISTIKADPKAYPWGRWIVPYETGTASKLQRMDPWLPHVRNGDVVLPTPEFRPWIRQWENEICGFPSYPFDDRWDACSQALAHIFGGGAFSYKDALAGLRKMLGT